MQRATRLAVSCALGLASLAPVTAADLAITNVRLHPAPRQPPIEHATVLIRDGKIERVGAGLETGGLEVLDGGGRVATAGLWNCHVHHSDPRFTAQGPAAGAQELVRDMLLRYGFTSVLDTGSDPLSTRALIAAIERGDLEGPRIFTAAGGFVATDGTPVYLPGIKLPELATPAEAGPAVNAVLDAGADGIKIFSGSFQGPNRTVLLPPEVIRAVTDAAHARSSFVVSHPTDRDGLVNAVENGVDVLAHTAPPAGPLGPDLVRDMLARKVALIPTLKLWSYELRRNRVPEEGVRQYQGAGVAQTAEYARAGGEILFGTDVGYMTDFDTAEELEMLKRAELDFGAVLAALTTHPARRFAGESGKVEPGAPGDLVIYVEDPARDVTAFSRVAYAVRGGKVVFSVAE
jgi:imidazolonepropionase-like amidohydrolase